ncbi:putative sucrose utilization protein SUC1 [Erysiphe neolycopersici]|uniref:Putative sucrose utilization protein SUC1 n=1 Tax=Erysiphe neolycopersici TaxID=212602 RepID=A0A420HKU2_9PEZI|nr:putative sucrose utilization protein SUC1 [Erysiphe neolycopersici]
MSTSIKRACDACHRRKVKCDGINPCRNCYSAKLCCTYNAIPQKKGPKGSRAKVISELRENQRQSNLSSKVTNRINGISSPPYSPPLAPTQGLLSTEIIKECIDFFFNNMYPSLPILHRGRLEQQILFADHNIDTYCLLTSLCAFMMIQPGIGIPGNPLDLKCLPGANLVSGNILLQETLRIRRGYDYLEAPTLNSLVTSFFLFGCYFGLDLHNKAWFHLREATTLAHVNGLQKEETYLKFDAIDASRRRRLFWLLFVTERAYAFQRNRPLSLQATISPPTQNDDPSDTQACHLNGFIDLVNLFRPFDEKLVTLWNKTRTECSQNYLAGLQKDLINVLPSYLNSTETQNADLRTSQQWLRTMVWQLSMQNGCLSSTNTDPSMTFQYPVDISRDLVSLTSQFSPKSMDVHGIGFIEKLFDIACSLTDVLSLLPSTSDSLSFGPRDYLHDIIGLLAVLRHGDHQFLPLLLAKVNDVLPRLVNPMIRTIPDTSPDATSSLCHEVSIYDDTRNTAGVKIASQFLGGNNRDVNNRGAVSKIKSNEYDTSNIIHGYPMFEDQSPRHQQQQQRIDDVISPVSPSVEGTTTATTSSSSEHGATKSYSVGVQSPILYPYSFPDITNSATTTTTATTSSGSEHGATKSYSLGVQSPILYPYSFPDITNSATNTTTSSTNIPTTFLPNRYGDELHLKDFKAEFHRVVEDNPRRLPIRSCSGSSAPCIDGNGFSMQIPCSVLEQTYSLHRSQSFSCAEL